MDKRCAESLDEGRLMAAIARGDMSAFGELIRRHQANVRSIAYRLCGRWDVADDIAQDVFLRILRSAHSYRNTASFTTWLYRIVFNLCMDWRRRRTPMRLSEVAPDDFVSDGTSQEALVRDEACSAIQRAIAELPDRQRAALVFHRFQGLTLAQIATISGWSESAVESLLVRAYAQLRDRLKAWAEI